MIYARRRERYPWLWVGLLLMLPLTVVAGLDLVGRLFHYAEVDPTALGADLAKELILGRALLSLVGTGVFGVLFLMCLMKVTRFCGHCGMDVTPRAMICPHCGARFEKAPWR